MGIKVPLDILKNNPYTESGLMLAHFYMLSFDTIGISKAPVEEWGDKSLMYGMMDYRVGKKNITFDLPANIMKFYLLDIGQTKYVVSAVEANEGEDVVLVHVVYRHLPPKALNTMAD